MHSCSARFIQFTSSLSMICQCMSPDPTFPIEIWSPHSRQFARTYPLWMLDVYYSTVFVVSHISDTFSLYHNCHFHVFNAFFVPLETMARGFTVYRMVIVWYNVKVRYHEVLSMHAMESCGSAGIASPIFSFSTGWRRVVGFISRPRVRAPPTHLYLRLGGPQSWFGHCGEDGNILPFLGMKLWFLDHPTCNLVVTLTVLSWFLW